VTAFASLEGKLALVTGGSRGIGRAIALELGRAGAEVVVGYRTGAEEAGAVAAETGGRAVQGDVSDAESAKALVEAAGDVDVLVNNAGLGRGMDKLWEGDPAGWDEMVDTNVKGLLYVTRAALPGMVERGRGHVINLGSVAGHEVYPGGAVYCATKHAVGAITRGLRMDVLGTGVRVSTVDPGMVETEFSVVRFHGDRERADRVYRGMTPLVADDIADTILWVATRPPHVCIDEIIIKPTDQASATMVHRAG
jgi:3-hydroxy acid dehydrogenase / malonic semialdehyde reductase